MKNASKRSYSRNNERNRRIQFNSNIGQLPEISETIQQSLFSRQHEEEHDSVNETSFAEPTDNSDLYYEH